MTTVDFGTFLRCRLKLNVAPKELNIALTICLRSHWSEWKLKFYKLGQDNNDYKFGLILSNFSFSIMTFHYKSPKVQETWICFSAYRICCSVHVLYIWYLIRSRSWIICLLAELFRSLCHFVTWRWFCLCRREGGDGGRQCVVLCSLHREKARNLRKTLHHQLQTHVSDWWSIIVWSGTMRYILYDQAISGNASLMIN